MKLLLSLLMGLLLAPTSSAQSWNYNKLVTDFQRALKHDDKEGMDKALRSAPRETLLYFERSCLDRRNAIPGSDELLDALIASWNGVFKDATVLENIRGWVESQNNDSLRHHRDARQAVDKCCDALHSVIQDKHRPSFEALRDSAVRAGNQMEEIGHLLDAAEAWAVVVMVHGYIPDPSPIERDNGIRAAERFVELRRSWSWTADEVYASNLAWLKSERERIRAAEASAKSRANQRSVETLVMPDVEDEVHDLEFQMLEAMELDYCARGGPVPPLWWEVQVPKDAKAKMAWFTHKPLFLIRMGATKFGVSHHPGDPAQTQEVGASGKPKPSLFYRGEGNTQPYAMWFFVGGERELVYHAELNLAPTAGLAQVFYRSASSWTTRIGEQTVTFYDDSCDGKLFQKEPYRMGLKLYALGDPDKGTEVPVLDSMRIGNGPRIPYSEFVKVGASWFHIRGRSDDTKVGVRAVNPELFKTGRVQLDWSGKTKARPELLVIQGTDILATAFFQIASGKEVEVPAGEYEICFGRIVSGSGVRVQLANVYRGRSKRFRVQAGKTSVLEMGAPFKLEFERGGDESQVEIEATRIVLHDKSGALFSGLHNAVVIPEVQAAADASGRAAKTFAKFTKMDDCYFVEEAAIRWVSLGRNVAMFPAPMGAKLGDTKLQAKLPFRGAKVGLLMRQHPLFGKLSSDFK